MGRESDSGTEARQMNDRPEFEQLGTFTYDDQGRLVVTYTG